MGDGGNNISFFVPLASASWRIITQNPNRRTVTANRLVVGAPSSSTRLRIIRWRTHFHRDTPFAIVGGPPRHEGGQLPQLSAYTGSGLFQCKNTWKRYNVAGFRIQCEGIIYLFALSVLPVAWPDLIQYPSSLVF